MNFPPTGLPLEALLPEIRTALQTHRRLILTAEPGAGKTTLVPLALMDEAWLRGQKVVMLEPRRVAAAGAATRMAQLLGEPLGRRVGYRVALESRVSAQTQVEVVTEGILTRQIQNDPELKGVGCLILDEFHERSLQGDLALALGLEVQGAFREDLRILIMSATLDSQALGKFLGDPPVIHAPGRTFPVETHYIPAPEGRDPWTHGVNQIHQAVREAQGDILVFLPGQGEIRRFERELNPGPGWEIFPLMGSLDFSQQKKVLEPAPQGQRRIILATNVAETSLTIPGIRTVVDLGLVRINRFDPSSGMDKLVTETLSQASADQRRGRAGRTAGGTCLRLWSPQKNLEPFTPPEIQRSDLAPVVLDSALWGSSKPTGLPWFTLPPAGAWNQARELLQFLGALDSQGHITEEGKAMTQLGLHPRLSHMVRKAQKEGLGLLAYQCAAVLTEPRFKPGQLDFTRNLEGFETWGRGMEMLGRWGASEAPGAANLAKTGLVLAWAFPDRVGKKVHEEESQDGSRRSTYQTVGGRAVWISGALGREEFLVFPEVDAQTGTAKAWSAAPVSREDLEGYFSDQWTEATQITWKDWTPSRQGGLVWGALLLKSRPVKSEDWNQTLDHGVLKRLETQGLEALPWSQASRSWLLRVRKAWAFWARQGKVAPEVWEDQTLVDQAPEWLLGWLNREKGPVITEELLFQALKHRLEAPWRSALETCVPTHLRVPSGSLRPLVYEEGKPVILEVRIQEIFGLASSPLIAGEPLLLHLLSPAQRPLQVTQDLASFWSQTYPEVRKEMRGRYPRHYWPENPLEAEPTARAKPRGT